MSDQTRMPLSSCDCIERINQSLADAGQNTMVETALWENLDTGTQMLKVAIPTWKPDPRSRKRMVPLAANYCPFCGVKYGWKGDPPTAAGAASTTTEGQADG